MHEMYETGGWKGKVEGQVELKSSEFDSGKEIRAGEGRIRENLESKQVQ